jgi:hypothetical protein
MFTKIVLLFSATWLSWSQSDFRSMALRLRLSPGLPLSNKWLYKTSGPGVDQVRERGITSNESIVFGGLAIMDVLGTSLDPWLCVPGFHRVCYYRTAGFFPAIAV